MTNLPFPFPLFLVPYNLCDPAFYLNLPASLLSLLHPILHYLSSAVFPKHRSDYATSLLKISQWYSISWKIMFKSLSKKFKTFHNTASIYFFLSSWLIPSPSFIQLPCGKHILWRFPNDLCLCFTASHQVWLASHQHITANMVGHHSLRLCYMEKTIGSKYDHYIRPHLSRPEREGDFPFLALKKEAAMLWESQWRRPHGKELQVAHGSWV